MKGRLEHELRIEKDTKKMLDGMPPEIIEWYYNLSVSMEPKSSQLYIGYIRQFVQFLDFPESMKTVTDVDVQRFMKSIETRTINGEVVFTSFSYRKTMYSALNKYFSFAAKKKWIDINPMELIRRAKQKDNINRVYLTEDDLKKILESSLKQPANENEKFQMLRDHAILRTFIATGIRETALTEINIEDIDFEKCELSVVDKGNLTHIHILGAKTILAIKDWLEVRNMMVVEKNNSALFLTKDGNRITSRSIYNIVAKYTELGLGKRLSPHKLRAAYGTILYNKTKDIRFVQERMGHSSVTTTQLYVVTDNAGAEKAAKLMDF